MSCAQRTGSSCHCCHTGCTRTTHPLTNSGWSNHIDPRFWCLLDGGGLVTSVVYAGSIPNMNMICPMGLARAPAREACQLRWVPARWSKDSKSLRSSPQRVPALIRKGPRGCGCASPGQKATALHPPPPLPPPKSHWGVCHSGRGPSKSLSIGRQTNHRSIPPIPPSVCPPPPPLPPPTTPSQ